MLFAGAGVVLAVGVAAFAAFGPVFALFGIPEMLGVNALVCAWIGAGLALLRRGWIASAIGFGVSAVVAHGWLSTWLVGWDAGFHYQILVGLLMQGLAAPLPRRRRTATAVACALAYVALAAWAPGAQPVAALAPWKESVFALMNVVTAVGVLTLVGVYYGAGIERARRERDGAQQALQQAFDETRAIVDNMAEGLVALDRDGRLRTVNPSLTRLLGVAIAAASDLPAALCALAARACASGVAEVGEVPLPEGRIAAAVASPLGPSEGAVVLVRDVTVEKEVDRMKTELTAVVSHELRTPLTSVLGFTRMIQSRLEARILPHTVVDDPKTARAVAQVRDNLSIILEEGQRLAALINDVLDIAKMESGSMTYASDPLDVADLIGRARAATSALFEGSPVRLEVDVAGGLPAVTGDRDRLLQVLVNLISNAAKFTDAGAVRLEARRREAGGLRLAVVDTGEGVPPEACEAIFDRFHQVVGARGDRPRGTGLGLPICRHIVEAHGGTIRAESVVGEGTTLVIELPTR